MKHYNCLKVLNQCPEIDHRVVLLEHQERLSIMFQQSANWICVISVGLNLFFLKQNYYTSSWPTRIFKSPFEAPPMHSTDPQLSKNSTIILIWFWPFGKHFDLTSCKSVFNIEGCYLTDDRALYSKAHGVIIHHRDIKWDLSNLPSQPRPFFQKWVWMHFESPNNTPKIPGLSNLFNVTLNYRQDADITIREQMIIKSPDTEDEIFPKVLKKKDKQVCWIVSNWNEQHDRVTYYKELKQHITIDTYGHAFQKPLKREEYDNVLTSCKFYLAFENTKSKDYMTEKLYNPLTKGSIPVVLGSPRYIYERFIPGDAFIHVDDFPSPKDLAQHLLSLDKNEVEYKKYFQWRKLYEVKHVDFPREHVCYACDYIRRKNNHQVFTNLYDWYWDHTNE
ncbi:4-galactosyl-N-acetylglucosaminide 3-alpha-L-fucosyltransferase 9-like isoform X2 [Electrophorus electricus]|uniref:4-galactosyl-N-acetylglucosaminide 3-alpha-L-fucosyltransferase 9-like isoform X2 n=1 Tax=Electrophorus electricus TaxID=8005 RepID=UPI0015D00130|nr:4-galactosyl-N-acetylglucosaminide 3-alpha-L-fucosyltransferase 9-like isoform X2 [Electrophorus electricus]